MDCRVRPGNDELWVAISAVWYERRVVRSRIMLLPRWLMVDPPPGHAAGTGQGVRERRPGAALLKSRLTGAPTRRLKVSIPRFFSPCGRSGRSAGGVGQETPGTAGAAPAGLESQAGPDRRGRRSLSARPRRSRQRPLAGRNARMISINRNVCQAKRLGRRCLSLDFRWSGPSRRQNPNVPNVPEADIEIRPNRLRAYCPTELGAARTTRYQVGSAT